MTRWGKKEEKKPASKQEQKSDLGRTGEYSFPKDEKPPEKAKPAPAAKAQKHVQKLNEPIADIPNGARKHVCKSCGNLLPFGAVACTVDGTPVNPPTEE